MSRPQQVDAAPVIGVELRTARPLNRQMQPIPSAFWVTVRLYRYPEGGDVELGRTRRRFLNLMSGVLREYGLEAAWVAPTTMVIRRPASDLPSGSTERSIDPDLAAVVYNRFANALRGAGYLVP